MPRFAVSTCSALFALVFVASACSGDDDAPPLGDDDGGGARGGEDSGGSSGSAGRGGSANRAGEDGGGTSQGGASAEGGGATAEGGDATGAGGGLGVAGEPTGVGGAAGPEPEPDFIESSGGSWPDSLTGICSNGKRLGVCPQADGAYFGQDGTYRINVPSYMATTSTLTDLVTGLVWQVVPPVADLTHAEAVSYCEELSLAEQTDWRLPTRLEYVSLLDAGKGAGYALPAAIALDATGTYWTASPSAITPGLFFVVDDAEGSWNVVVEETTFDARCVRGATLTGELEVGTGVVTDTMTRLTWQASELTATPRTWVEALEYCESLSLAGENDWRLPSIKELATLVDETATASPAIAASFGAGAEQKYWSSSPAAPFLSDPAAFVLDTGFGISMTLNMGERAAARCLRTAD
ncbi:MAG: hypothetical protein K0R38_7323 [Polyangiaceae bacterium]|jgi:hypothetical protein|nr:hypothetical protein [Polyangiaceae bacterium]